MNSNHKNTNRSAGKILALILLGLAISLPAATITGKVKNTDNGKYLPGANVILVGTNYGAATDRAGDFRISNIPTGNYTLAVKYIGFVDYTQDITVTDNISDNNFIIAIKVSYIEMGEVVVSGLRQGEAKALSQQKASDHIENIISSDQIDAFPDPNAAEALRRLPGVSVQQDQGEGRYVLIRGTEARLNSTQINGNNIPSPEDDNRNVSLDVIPSDLLGAIEVSKALTPDMDGDAIGGSVNLITKNAFDYDGQVIKADLSGGYRNLRGDLGQKMTFTYANQFMGGKLGLLVGGSYNNSDMATDDLEMEWNDEYELVTDEVDDYEVDEDDITDTTFIYTTEATDGKVLDVMEWRVYDLNRKRVGLNLNLDYKLNNNSSFYFRYLHNTYTDIENRHLLAFEFGKSIDEEEPGSGYTSATSVTGAPVVRELKDRKSVSKIQSIAIGGKHDIGNLKLDYDFSTSSAEEVRDPSQDIVFEQGGFDLDFDISDEIYPTVTVTNGQDYNDLGEFEFDENEWKNGEETTDKDYTGAINVQMPYSFGSATGNLKFGGKFRSKNKISDKTTELIYGWDGADDLTAADFELAIEGGEFMDGNYSHEVGIDPEKFTDYFDENIGDFESEIGLEAKYFETWEADEDVKAFYGMTTINFGKLMLLAGARVEMTSTTYQGWEGDIALAEDDESVMEEVKGTNDYTNFLPMVHLRYNVSDRLVARAAFTQTIARPDYITLVPYKFFDDGELFEGNPELNPTQSTNLDIMVEYYVGTLGILSGGFFTKTMVDYIYSKVEEPEDMLFGDEEVEEWSYPVNGADATLSGFELQWQQALTFLPGALNGLGVYVNYTSTSSEAKYLDRDATTLPGQAASVGNFGLSYEKFGFAAKLSVNFHGEYISEVGGDEDEDIYYADNTQVDLSASYKLKNNIKLYVDATNITNTPLVYFVGDPEFPIQRELYSFGVRAGIKFDL
ncbi:MAG: TonB-dependent receptor [Candidatus Neomarinimicrobiota bacterium]